MWLTDVTEQASWSTVFCNDALENFKTNLPTAVKIKQTGATCYEKRVQWNRNIMFD